jgi:hypothetical protein
MIKWICDINGEEVPTKKDGAWLRLTSPTLQSGPVVIVCNTCMNNRTLADLLVAFREAVTSNADTVSKPFA